MVGTVGILNVGNGDTKLIFDKSNPAECIRAARIVKDMLRRGYALHEAAVAQACINNGGSWEIPQPHASTAFQCIRGKAQ